MTEPREPFLTNSRLRPTPLARSAKPITQKAPLLSRDTPLIQVRAPIRKRRPKSENSAARRPGMSPKHLAMIRLLPCAVTGRPGPNDPHHLKTDLADERGIGRKATDRWAVPLCRERHEDVERVGSRNERAWFQERGIADPKALAEDLWRATGDLDQMKRVVYAHMRGVPDAAW